MPVDRPVLSRAVFFGLGGLFTTVFEPAGLSLLVPVLLLPYFYVCLTLSPRDAAGHGFWFGAGLFICGTYWIYLSVTGPGQAEWWIGVLLVIVLSLIMAFYAALTAWLISRLSHSKPWWFLLVAPAGWTLVEWLRGWVLTGFPWMSLGYSQIDTVLAGWAPVVGVYGISAMLVLSTSALLISILMRGRQQWLALGVALLPWICGGVLQSVEWTQPAGLPIQSTLIQAGIPQDQKWLCAQRTPTMNFYRDATRVVTASSLVVWPEVAIPSVMNRRDRCFQDEDYIDVDVYIDSLQQISRDADQTILFGILESGTIRNGAADIHNSVVLIDGERRQIYRKRHLVPFGEYFPVPAKVREWLRMMNLPFSDLTPGAKQQDLLVAANGTRLAVAICYEDAYAAELLYALPEAALLINVSNDAWFGDSIAPHQHLQIARMRSLEIGRYTIRATNTGISAFIDSAGKVLRSGAQFEPITMTMNVQPRKGMTPYVGSGNWPVIVLCLLVIAGFWLRSRAS